MAELEKKTKDKRPKQAQIAEEQIIKTQKEAARYAGVDCRTIRRWIHNGMPRTKQGYYIKGMLDFYRKNEGQAPHEDKLRQQKAEANLKETKAKLADLEYQIRQGGFLKKEDYERQQLAKVIAVKRALLGLGRKLAPQLVKVRTARKIQALIDKEIRNIINRFAEE